MPDVDLDHLHHYPRRMHAPRTAHSTDHGRTPCQTELNSGTGRPSLTDDRITHEMMHVLAYELGVSASDHHRWLMRKGVCGDICEYVNPLEAQ